MSDHPTGTASLPALPPVVEETLRDFVGAAVRAFGTELKSVVLYGSAAEGRLRATSDVNVIVVLGAYERDAAGLIREPLRVAQAAAALKVMFLLESELPDALEAFAPKFADVLQRRRVLHGSDVFAGRSVPRAAEVAGLKQGLLNLVLRLRAAYAERGLRGEQLALVAADAAGPLRTYARDLLDLEGRPAASPKEALESVAASLGGDWADTLARLSEARETRALPPGVAGPVVFRLIDLTLGLRRRAQALA
jgi:predicted nucleotidyltransferase